jgi:hypothetical protein
VNVQQELIRIIRDTVGALAAGGAVDWDVILEDLSRTSDAALAAIDVDEGLVTCVVSSANLLFDCARKVVSPSAILQAIQRLDTGPRWNDAFESVYRQGRLVDLKDDEANGFSAVRWDTFTRHIASLLGFSSDAQELEKLWENLKDANLSVPADDARVMHASRADSAWVTDDAQDGDTLVTSDPTSDVYDALGLNWSGRFLDFPDAGGRTGEVRAVMLCCPLHVRQRAARTLHCPTAVDGWVNLLFVPRQPTGHAWPDHGSYTARPHSEAESLPEAIHGYMAVPGSDVSLRRLERIRVGNRAMECGEQLMRRAVERLRGEVMS